jgi:DNA repair photolyase
MKLRITPKRRRKFLNPLNLKAWIGAFARRDPNSAPMSITTIVDRYLDDTHATGLKEEPASLEMLREGLGAVLAEVWDIRVEAGIVQGATILDRVRKGGKEWLCIPSATVLNLNTGFNHKLLSTTGTITAGSACLYSCWYCSVGSSMFRSPQTRILRLLGIKHREAMLRREDPVETLRQQLTFRNGEPRYKGPADYGTVIMSPIVDPLPNEELMNESLELTALIHELTNWEVRLLTKSGLVKRYAEGIPDEHHDRVIFGLSLGILDEGIRKAVEKMTAPLSVRLDAYRWLQENGFRTYSMPCPVLPQKNYRDYAHRLMETMNWDKDEHIWCEALNARGQSNQLTIDALREAGYACEADLLMDATSSREAWEIDYNRPLFQAMVEVCPPAKLRYLVYAEPQHRDFWLAQRDRGAVVLGKDTKLDD